jgi:hypothetical protein
MSCDTDLLAQAIGGTLMKCSSRTDAFTTSGVQWIRNGDMSDILVQTQRDMGAAKKFFRKLLRVEICSASDHYG